MSPPRTPPVPDYESACAGGAAAAEVMKRVFGKDRIAFGACSLSLPGGGCNDAKPVRRSYGGFDEAAAENAVSRVYIGFHFRDENGPSTTSCNRTAPGKCRRRSAERAQRGR